MIRRTTSLAVASLAAASFITLASASASAKDHADWALEFIDNTAEDGSENLWDTPCSIDWDAYSGTTKAACFFTLSLKKAMGYADLDVRQLWETASPTSYYYYDFINRSPSVGAAPPEIETYFRRVTRAIDIQKGDIIAINKTSTYAGHTMIVIGAPEELLPQIAPRYSGTKQYAVPIADSTESKHGCSMGKYRDSRWVGDCANGGEMKGSAGTAYIRVYTDSLTGILLGYTWSVTSSTDSYYSPSTRPMRVGRLFKLPDALSTEPPPPPP
jgi:hypothetical protein